MRQVASRMKGLSDDGCGLDAVQDLCFSYWHPLKGCDNTIQASESDEAEEDSPSDVSLGADSQRRQ